MIGEQVLDREGVFGLRAERDELRNNYLVDIVRAEVQFAFVGERVRLYLVGMGLEFFEESHHRRTRP